LQRDSNPALATAITLYLFHLPPSEQHLLHLDRRGNSYLKSANGTDQMLRIAAEERLFNANCSHEDNHTGKRAYGYESPYTCAQQLRA